MPLLRATFLPTRGTAYASTSVGQAFMVWGHECISKIEVTPETTIEAPLKDDGEPDMKKAMGYHSAYTYKKSCGHIEVRK